MPFALTDEGLEIESADEIREGINADQREAFGNSLDLSDGTAQGQANGIYAVALAEVGELLQAIWSAMDPDANTGASQDAIAAITGTQRRAATSSTVTVTLTGDTSTVVPEGSVVSVDGTGDRFATLADATLVAITAWATGTVYALDARRKNGGNVYVCVGAGTSAGSGGPTTEDDEITDNTCLWRFIGEGEAAVDVATEAEETGPIVAASGDLNVIETPISGWSDARNLRDADLGRAIETNEALRARREVELRRAGAATLEAIRADLIALADVTAVGIFQNTGDVTDGDGVPPHSIEALISCPNTAEMDQIVFDQLLASVAAGIRTHGVVVGTATDSAGNDWTMKFTRPAAIDIYVAVTLTKDPDLYPLDGDDQVKDAIVTFGDAQRAGKNVVASSLVAQCFVVPGVLDVTLMYIDDAPAPAASTTIPISLRQIAVFDSSHIDVTSSDGVP